MSMADFDIACEILKDIRDESRGVRSEFREEVRGVRVDLAEQNRFIVGYARALAR
jgi:hypothetical protein